MQVLKAYMFPRQILIYLDTPPPPADHPPRGHDGDVRDGNGTDNDKLACFARLLRSKHNPPLDVAAVDKDGN